MQMYQLQICIQKYFSIHLLKFNLIIFIKKTMSILKQLAEYLYLKKKDPNETKTQWMKYMHGMNRISLMMFLLALLFILYKLFIHPLFKH